MSYNYLPSDRKEYVKKLSKEVDWQNEEKIREFRLEITPLIKYTRCELAELLEILPGDAINRLLIDSVTTMPRNDERMHLIDFLLSSGYRDAPEIDVDGIPVMLRDTPLLRAAACACNSGLIRQEILKLFQIYNRYECNYTDAAGFSHYHVACHYGCDEVVKKFLEIGQSPNLPVTETGDTPLHLAVDRCHADVMKTLLLKGANPNAVNKTERHTPLHVACMRRAKCGDIDLVNMLFELSAYKYHPLLLDALDECHHTPMMLALERGFKEPVEQMLRLGADPNVPDANQMTPLHHICDKYEVAFARTFFAVARERGASLRLDERDWLGRTPLHLALCHRDVPTTELLLREGADPNLADSNGTTGLHIICQAYRYEMDDLARVFFAINEERGQALNVDAEDEERMTPLDCAVMSISLELVDLLLNNGANRFNFSFDALSRFGERQLQELPNYRDEVRLRLAANTLGIIERLERRDEGPSEKYEMDRDDASTIMQFLYMCDLLLWQSELTDNWHSDESFAARSREIAILPTKTLYQFVRMPARYASKALTSERCLALTDSSNPLWDLPREYRELTTRYLAEMMLRKFFRSWAADYLGILFDNRLPPLICELVLDELINRDLMNICLACEN